MTKNSFVLVISQEVKDENKGFVDFQIVSFSNRIGYEDLLHI